MSKPLTREQELEKAIEAARLPPREYRIYRALFKRAEWNTATIKKQFQPWNEAELAGDSKMSLASVKRGLAHLERHGWITRVPRRKPGRKGPAVSFILLSGSDCDCQPERPGPVSDAERARRYRARKKEAQSDVTEGLKEAQKCVTLRLASRDENAGHTPNGSKSVREGGEGEKRAALTATEVVPRLPADSFFHLAMNKLYEEERP
jgi:hypothetical protein